MSVILNVVYVRTKTHIYKTFMEDIIWEVIKITNEWFSKPYILIPCSFFYYVKNVFVFILIYYNLVVIICVYEASLFLCILLWAIDLLIRILKWTDKLKCKRHQQWTLWVSRGHVFKATDFRLYIAISGVRELWPVLIILIT